MIPEIKSLKFHGVNFGYENHLPLFVNVDVEFPMNAINWIRSSSGSGKTTLLQILAGLTSPHKGAYFINEQNVSEMSFEEFNPYRLGIGYVFDVGGLISNRTLFDNLMLPLSYHRLLPHDQAVETVLETLDYFELSHFKNNRPAMVSSGVRKTICIARALMLNPQVLLLDDPTLGLGEVAIKKVMKKMRSMQTKKTLKHIFISTNDELFMQNFTYQIIKIENEQIKVVNPCA